VLKKNRGRVREFDTIFTSFVSNVNLRIRLTVYS